MIYYSVTLYDHHNQRVTINVWADNDDDAREVAIKAIKGGHNVQLVLDLSVIPDCD